MHTPMDISPVVVQNYKDGNLELAKAAGYNVVQKKYDGWNARIEIHYGWVTWYSKTGRVVNQICYPDDQLHAVLYAEWMHGTQWAQDVTRKGHTFVYDLFSLSGTVLRSRPYRERYSLLLSIKQRLPLNFSLVQCFPISQFNEVWADESFEGVVFRNSAGTLDETLMRQKRTVTEQLKIVRVNEGTNRLVGMMGSVTAVTKEGVEIDVGGGWEDSVRYDIFKNPQKYLGRWFDASSRGKFESGSLRHPNFERWRDDLTGA